MATFAIRGKNIEVTPALKDYVEKKLSRVTKHFETVGEISVLLSVVKGRHNVEVTLPMPGMLIRGEESTMDMYASIDLVVEKLDKQIEKHKTRLARKLRMSHKPETSGNVRIIDNDEEFSVVKMKRFAVKPMDVQEAVMQMNLINHDFFVFRNTETEEVSVVYRRKDGQYGLIEPGV
jgi:putative sigma-54 modulation protein